MLAHALVSSAGAEPTRWIYFLHGILGAGNNLRTIAKAVVAQRPDWGVALVDLRLHGASQDVSPPHDVAACARDLVALEAAMPGPVRAVLGHSFGGKVALEYLRLAEALEAEIIVDSSPGARPDERGSEGTRRVVELLRAMPASFATRQEFIDRVMKDGHSRDIANWLALNVRARPDGTYAFGLDVEAITTLLDDYFQRDEWDAIEATRAKVALVVGGASTVVDGAEREHALRLAAQTGGRVSLHVIEGAGHWVHVDAASELVRITTEALPR